MTLLKLVIKEITIDNKRLIIVGDIHGCFDEFIILLKNIKYDNEKDILISVGDFLMKGPKSKETLKFFMESKNCYSVMGNHEYAILRWYDAIKNKNIPHGIETWNDHQSFAKELNDKQLSYLRELPHMIRIKGLNETLIIVHAGINPYNNLQNQKAFDIMHTRNIFNKVCIDNNDTGEPWVNVLKKIWKSNELFIFGHDAIRNLQKGKKYIGLDSACVFGKQLSCYIYPKKEIVSVNAFEQYILMKK